MSVNTRARNRAFTLIELLIVVAIIAILAAIAVPNFLEAQTRSKVSRAKSDMRSTLVALEAYVVDHNHYPPPISFEPPPPFTVVEPAAEPFEGFVSSRVTTPVAYITSLSVDIFEVDKADEHPKKATWHYSTQENNSRTEINEPQFLFNLAIQLNLGSSTSYRYMIFSHGPDLVHQDGSSENGDPVLYDSTNGTVSKGDIYCFGPGGSFK